MATVTEKDLHDACYQWLKEKAPDSSIAVTVTFNRTNGGLVIPERVAQETIRMFCRRLNSEAHKHHFKRAKRRQLAIIPAAEGGWTAGEKHPHMHFLLEVPEGWTNEGWIKAVERLIQKMIWLSSTQYDIKPVRDDGWLCYILKLRDKKSFADSIDFANLWVNKK